MASISADGRWFALGFDDGTMPFRAVKGMNDILPEQMARWQRLESAFRETMALYGYGEVRTPVVEETQLFVRSIGESTEVVDKEMYSFARHDTSLTLRPEGTAGAARAFLEHGVYSRAPLTRWYYLGPMFRAERPQRGRYRQFWQAGGEVYGDQGPVADAEMIVMLCDLLQKLGVTDLHIAVNSIGSPQARERYRQLLLDYLRPRAEHLSEHARARLEDNPLRVLDSKDERDRTVVSTSPSILDALDAEDQEHFSEVTRMLDGSGVGYRIEPRLVRGLDYYTRTVFEISTSSAGVGAQNALVGGGRYDTLLAGLGGPQIAAVGFAMGLERLLLAMPEEAPKKSLPCYFVTLGAETWSKALELAQSVRRAGYRAELDARQGASLKSQLRRADALGARYAVVVGPDELQRQVAALKDLAQHTQRELPLDQLVPTLLGELSHPQQQERPH